MKSDLSAICSYVKGKIPVASLAKKNYVSTENMQPNRGGLAEATSMPSVAFTQSYEKNDVLVSNIRPYFKKIWLARADGGCSNDVLVIRAKNGVNPKFLYYVLSDDAFFNYSTATSKGTKMPRGDKTAIMQYQVPIFDEDTQIKIVSILASLDEKIELTQKINENLERQAQEIFKHHFLDVQELPDGWKQGNLLDIADYLNGLAMQKYRPLDGEPELPVLKIKELRQGSCDSSSELCSASIRPEYIVHNGDVIFSWSGSLLIDLWCGGTCGLNQHLFKVTSNNYEKWFYYLWTAHHLDRFIAIAADKATTMGHIRREELAKAKVLIPSPNDYAEISALLGPIIDCVIANRIENRKLTTIRDTLLPKLMSGAINISDIHL